MRGWLLLPVLLAIGCKNEPGVGDPCKPKDRRCLDAKRELACQSGTFVEVPCKGPRGCREEIQKLHCDITGNAPGDPCSTDDEGIGACTQEGTAWVVCRSGKYLAERCRGPKGCHDDGGRLRCDQSVADDGDPCARETNACSPDGKRVLTCQNGKFVTQARCPGEGGCSIAEGEVTCSLGKKQQGTVDDAAAAPSAR